MFVWVFCEDFSEEQPTASLESVLTSSVHLLLGADGAILVYDTTDPHSLDHLDHWRNEFLEQVGGGMAALSDTAAQFPFVVLGNKIDKVRPLHFYIQEVLFHTLLEFYLSCQTNHLWLVFPPCHVQIDKGPTRSLCSCRGVVSDSGWLCSVHALDAL